MYAAARRLRPSNEVRARTLALSLAFLATGCGAEKVTPLPAPAPLAEGISAPLGEPLPRAPSAQVAAFERGRELALKRFTLREGLGPVLNVTFCAACHERPVTGGSAGLYRNFFLSGVVTADGAFFPGESAGEAGGVIRLYDYSTKPPTRPVVPAVTNVVASRNPIPFFGVGLLAALPESAILRHADPDDADGDGISGRPNYDRGFVGRFGRKAQTVSIEGFIRGPLFNHLGITSNPLSEELRGQLPVDSRERLTDAADWLGARMWRTAQAAAPAAPLSDDDDAPDPELSEGQLFDLVSFVMLLAAPAFDPPTPASRRGERQFETLGCASCHTPRLLGADGAIPTYSDLLLHDMGPELADGIVQNEATGSEFRTQPLWGIAAVGPYLHDGRATTLEEAILAHGGEGTGARDAFAALPQGNRDELVTFLRSLGGRAQASPGLLPPGAPIPAVGAYGGPVRELDAGESERFERGRRLFDRDFGFSEGVGEPRFNGDSCRACHFEPVLGGAGPRGVNVIRHGIANAAGQFAAPAAGTILHRSNALRTNPNRPEPRANAFELRQTPHVFGLGLIDAIADATIRAGADPDDADGDGISGRASVTDGGRLGRLGWKAQVPSLAEFVRDAFGNELGMTLPDASGFTFGRLYDNDDVPDPELGLADADALVDFLRWLGPPPRQTAQDPALAERGETLFTELGCARCHTPTLPGPDGPVALYSDLLLHDVVGEVAQGVEDGSASRSEFRTAPLWGLSHSAPYLHSGAADTYDRAIRAHAGEASAASKAYADLTESRRQALHAFLDTL